jgi:Aldehyde dehydrogenase family
MAMRIFVRVPRTGVGCRRVRTSNRKCRLRIVGRRREPLPHSRLAAGVVIVNHSTDYRIDAMPFGGVKPSGIGREGIRFAVQN